MSSFFEKGDMAQSIEAGFWKKNQKTLAPWLFLAPGIIMFLLYVIIPIFQSIQISFYEWDGLGPKTLLVCKITVIC
jgi:multiple sugar transport system permease protein